MSIGNFDALLEKSSMMPDYFWKELEESNQAKAAHIPLALILQSEWDHNGVFSDVFSRENILTVAKTHRVAFKMIGEQAGRGIQEKIEETAQQQGRSIDVLVIGSHGSPDGLFLSEKKCYGAEDIREKDFAHLSKGGRIILFSCFSGQIFAPQLAKVANIDVVATTLGQDSRQSVLYFCEKHGIELVSMMDGKQNALIFHPNKEFTLPCLKDAKWIETDVNLWIKDAKLGNANSQWRLGHLYWHGHCGLKKSAESAIYWWSQAEKGGSVLSRANLDWLDPPYSGDFGALEQRYLLAANKFLLEEDRGFLPSSDILVRITFCSEFVKFYKERGLYRDWPLQLISNVIKKVAKNNFLDSDSAKFLRETHQDLGDLYMNWKDAHGKPAPQYTKAFDCYREAQSGDKLKDVAFELTKMYEQRLGVIASELQAIGQFENAEKKGAPEVSAKAKIELKRISAKSEKVDSKKGALFILVSLLLKILAFFLEIFRKEKAAPSEEDPLLRGGC